MLAAQHRQLFPVTDYIIRAQLSYHIKSSPASSTVTSSSSKIKNHKYWTHHSYHILIFRKQYFVLERILCVVSLGSASYPSLILSIIIITFFATKEKVKTI